MAAVERQAAQGQRAEEALLEIAHVEKSFTRYRRRRTSTLQVLRDVSLRIARCDLVTVIGPSGCGKTTLLNCVAGLETVDAGAIRIDGVEIHTPGEDRAVVFQAASLLPWRTIERNVAYGLELRRQFSRAEIAERVQGALERVGLAGFESHYPHEVSGGMQQRANLARALAVNPKLVLMDEPFGALDALTKEVMQDDLQSLAAHSEWTAIFITHDIDEAVFLGDRVVVMSAAPGEIVAEIPVPFPRPRTRDVTETPAFTALVAQLREMIRGRGRTHPSRETTCTHPSRETT